MINAASTSIEAYVESAAYANSTLGGIYLGKYAISLFLFSYILSLLEAKFGPKKIAIRPQTVQQAAKLTQKHNGIKRQHPSDEQAAETPSVGAALQQRMQTESHPLDPDNLRPEDGEAAPLTARADAANTLAEQSSEKLMLALVKLVGLDREGSGGKLYHSETGEFLGTLSIVKTPPKGPQKPYLGAVLECPQGDGYKVLAGSVLGPEPKTRTLNQNPKSRRDDLKSEGKLREVTSSGKPCLQLLGEGAHFERLQDAEAFVCGHQKVAPSARKPFTWDVLASMTLTPATPEGARPARLNTPESHIATTLQFDDSQTQQARGVIVH